MAGGVRPFSRILLEFLLKKYLTYYQIASKDRGLSPFIIERTDNQILSGKYGGFFLTAPK